MQQFTVVCLSAIALVVGSAAHAQTSDQAQYSESDLHFLQWVAQRFETEHIPSHIMSDDAKIFAAKDFCARLDRGDSIAQIQQGVEQRAADYPDPEARRLMISISSSLLYGGVTYYCPQYLSEIDYAYVEVQQVRSDDRTSDGDRLLPSSDG
jgi:hypothetical protein